MNIPTTENEGYGFYGTIRNHADPDVAWRIALPAIAGATGTVPDDVRAFLDGRSGRHFADDVVNGLAGGRDLSSAVDWAISRWLGWTTSHRTAHRTGVPGGQPFLTAYVAAEAAAVR